MEHLDAAPQRIAEPVEPQRHDHEFLDIHRIVGMLAAIDDVHHRGRQHAGIAATQISVQGLAGEIRGGFGDGQGHAQDGVGAQVLLVRRAVHLDHFAVQADLVQRVQSLEFRRDLPVHVFNRKDDSLAQEAFFVSIPQFPRFVGSRAGSTGDRRPPEGAIHQGDFHLNRRVSAAIQDLTAMNFSDCAHRVSFRKTR